MATNELPHIPAAVESMDSTLTGLREDIRTYLIISSQNNK